MRWPYLLRFTVPELTADAASSLFEDKFPGLEAAKDAQDTEVWEALALTDDAVVLLVLTVVLVDVRVNETEF